MDTAMNRAMNHDEIAELLGAYALDAVDPDEARTIAAHVEECPRCAAELAEYHEVAGMLANDGGDAPGELWDRIAAQATRPDGGLSGSDAPVAGMAPVRHIDEARTAPSAQAVSSRRSRALRQAGMAVAGVAAALIALMAIQVSRLDTRVNHLNALAQRAGLSQAVQAALLDPNAKRVTLARSASPGPALAELVLLPSGTAYLINSHLAALPTDQTYQLWGVVGGRAVSLGLLGNHPSTVPFRVDSSAAVSTFAVTAERAGGVVTSTHAPVAQGSTSTT
jgi:hypothetical protein